MLKGILTLGSKDEEAQYVAHGAVCEAIICKTTKKPLW